MKSIALMILMTISINSFAQSTTLNKGDIAPFRGILLTPERAEKAAKAEKKVPLLQENINLQQDISKYYKKELDQTRSALTKEKIGNTFENAGYFLLGAVLASVAFKIQGKIGEM